MKVIVVKFPSIDEHHGGVVATSVKEAIAIIEGELDAAHEHSEPLSISIEIKEMDQADVESLPEFEGW